jgi:serine protease AprX
MAEPTNPPVANESIMPPPGVPNVGPLASRLSTNTEFTGRGITIAFIDSGFHSHPDLTEPRNRVLVHYDVRSDSTTPRACPPPDASSWHGMMTSVVCAGNGHLSSGRYKGLAQDAEVVLLKAGTVGRIAHHDIRRGIEWAIKHREEYAIRVLNISCGGDYEATYVDDPICRAVEEATRVGIVVVAAVGNAGWDTSHRVLPPASSPAAITVGGIDDAKDSTPGRVGMYHSSYGPTIDGLQKPEVVAQANWVVAPILPETPTSAQAQLLDSLARSATDAEAKALMLANPGVDPELDAVVNRESYFLKNLVDIKRRDQKIVSGHYKYVDGTSFAAPIVSAVVAQMLEANPQLSPYQVKKILIDTASRLPNVPVDRQGWGVINPAKAVAKAQQLRL